MKPLTKIQREKAAMLFNKYRKLSDFYQSRSTNYASCLCVAPFSIITDTDVIVSKGFSSRVKAIVTVDMTDERVSALAKEVTDAENARAKAWADREAQVKIDDARNSAFIDQFNDTDRMSSWKSEMKHLNSQKSRRFAMNKLHKLGCTGISCTIARAFQRKIESV